MPSHAIDSAHKCTGILPVLFRAWIRFPHLNAEMNCWRCAAAMEKKLRSML